MSAPFNWHVADVGVGDIICEPPCVDCLEAFPPGAEPVAPADEIDYDDTAFARAQRAVARAAAAGEIGWRA